MKETEFQLLEEVKDIYKEAWIKELNKVYELTHKVRLLETKIKKLEEENKELRYEIYEATND